jgi:hypothetical protein
MYLLTKLIAYDKSGREQTIAPSEVGQYNVQLNLEHIQHSELLHVSSSSSARSWISALHERSCRCDLHHIQPLPFPLALLLLNRGENSKLDMLSSLPYMLSLLSHDILFHASP